MAQEINLGGTIYVSSKRAAEITGYSQDYIGQLARGGQIEARRVAGLWYVLEASLAEHKHKADEFTPTPPVRVVPAEAEASVSFDGKDYISASRAAKITGYTQDYVGQLARGEKVPSRQIGSRWYVDRAAIIAHKREKDDLLGAVQSEAVGIQRDDVEKSHEMASESKQTTEPHFSYFSEPLQPEVNFEPIATEQPSEETSDETEILQESVTEAQDEVPNAESENQIPIRVVEEPLAAVEYDVPAVPKAPRASSFATARIAMFSVAFLAIIVVAGLTVVRDAGIAMPVGNTAIATVNAAAGDAAGPIASAAVSTAGRLSRFAASAFSKELVYKRQSL